jgi:hypothetical protein
MEKEKVTSDTLTVGIPQNPAICKAISKIIKFITPQPHNKI